uniref:poly(A)-specific ribonuclease n=1 Tax=Kalanchoe fedtschenkoi TaxID=63787 RepID=A0A7N0V3B1_KALFE
MDARRHSHSHSHSPPHHKAMISFYYQGSHAPPGGRFLCADSEYLYPALYIPNSDFPNGRQHIQIRRVGRLNFAAEAQVIRHLVRNTEFNVISMDMEYPGTVYTSSDYKDRHPAAQYRLMKANVDELGLIQVGITLCDKSGNLATLDSTGGQVAVVWEFAIRDFDIDKQRYNEKSIRFLVRLGLNLRFHREEGIHSHEFAQMLIDTGLVMNHGKEVRWITHCGAYDFGYLIKALTKKALPEKLQDFMKLVYFYFGRQVYDTKFMMMFCNDPCNKNNVRKLSGPLVNVAAKLGMRRILGIGHPAGTGCFLTYQVFHELMRLYSTESAIGMTSAGNIHLLANY